MLVETSAIVAILRHEPEHDEFVTKIENDPTASTTIVNAVEASLGVGKEIEDYRRAGELVQRFLVDSAIKIHGIPDDLFQEVVDAYVRFGKGMRHPAKLNFGDCFSYAMAKRLGVPLLYKGKDFAATDLA